MPAEEPANGPEGTGGPISTKWGVRGWPTIYILDHEGRIRFHGPRGDAMTKSVKELLAEWSRPRSRQREPLRMKCTGVHSS